MTPAQLTAYRSAMHSGHMLAGVMRLCAVGLDAMEEKQAVSAAISAMHVLAEAAERISDLLDTAEVAGS